MNWTNNQTGYGATGAASTILRLPEVLKRTGTCRSAAYKLIAEGRFPAPIKIAGTRSSGWDANAVQSWIDSQLSGAAKPGVA